MKARLTCAAMVLLTIPAVARGQEVQGPRFDVAVQASFTGGGGLNAVSPAGLIHFNRTTALEVGADLPFAYPTASPGYTVSYRSVRVLLKKDLFENRKAALFFTAGVNVTSESSTSPAVVFPAFTVPPFHFEATEPGGVVGVGVEGRLTPHLAIRAEGQLYAIGSQFFNFRFAIGVAVPIGHYVEPPRRVPVTAARGLAEVASGDAVTMTMNDGLALTGKILSASTDEVSVRVDGATKTVRFADIKAIEASIDDPISDGVLKGALIGGLAAGSGMALFMGNYGECPCSTTPALVTGFAAAGAGIGALLGAVIDRAHHAKTVVYRAPGSALVSMAPVFVKNGGGAMMSVRW